MKNILDELYDYDLFHLTEIEIWTVHTRQPSTGLLKQKPN